MKRFLSLLALGVGLMTIGTIIGSQDSIGPPTSADSGVLAGICEASAVVPWQGGYLVGDNEGQTQLYDFDAALAPGPSVPLPEPMEDIESVAPTPAGLWVVGSQSNNKSGEPRPGRARALIMGHPSVQPDLSGCRSCVDARKLSPKDGGLNVEGAAAWQGSLWLGLRSPLVEGDATLLRMEGDSIASLRAAEEVRVNLDGRGVRDLMVSGDKLLILAGPSGSGDENGRLYSLAAPGQNPVRLPVDLPPHSEGIAPTPDGRLLVVTDGDGKPGEACIKPATWTKLAMPAI